MQNTVDIRANISLLGQHTTVKPFTAILADVQEYVSRNYADAIQYDGEDHHTLLKSYIAKYLNDQAVEAEGIETQDELCELLYGEMAGFSFLSKYIFDPEVEEVNINQWRDVKITYSDGRIVPSKERFSSPSHAIDVVRRLLHQSNMILDNAQPIVVGHLAGNIRITVMGVGVIDKDKGVSVSIRIVNPKKLSRQEFIDNGTCSAEMLDFLALTYRYGASMCITGATTSGKTTLLSYLLSQVPHNKRIVTIEQGCREFELTACDEEGNVLNNVVHLLTRPSKDANQNITQVKLLETTLTINPDCIAVAEMKGPESLLAVSAANTGHSVISTTHANSCRDTYERVLTLCKLASDMSDSTLLSLATKAFPIVAFISKPDNTRRIMEITESEICEDGSRKMRTLYQFVVTEDENDGDKLTGHFEKVQPISESLRRRLQLSGMPLSVLKRFL